MLSTTADNGSLPEENNPLPENQTPPVVLSVPQPQSSAPDSSPPTPPQEPTAPPPVQEEIGLLNLLAGTLHIVKKKFWFFMGVTILNFIVLGLLYIIGMPLALVIGSNLGKYGMLAGFLVIGLVTLLLSYLFYGSMAHQAASVMQNESVSFGHSLSVILKKIGTFLHLCFKMLIFSRIWLVFVILLLWTLVGFVGSILGSSGILIVNYILGLFGLFIIPYAMIRLLWAVLAIPTLMAYPTISAKEALLASVEMTKGRWWMLFSFITVFSFLMGLIPAAINFLASFTGSALVQIIALIATVVFVILTYTASISFFQVMVAWLSDKTKHVTLNTGVLIGAILITLAPVILAIVIPLLGIAAFKSSLTNSNNSAPFSYDAESDYESGYGKAPAAHWVEPGSEESDAIQEKIDANQANTTPRLPKLPTVKTAETSDGGVPQQVFDDLFKHLFEHEIWATYYPMFAADEQVALQSSVNLESSGVRPVEQSKPMFSPFNKILNYLGKGMYDYKRIDEKVVNDNAFYLYTAMAGNLKDFRDPARYEDLFCYPFVKTENQWKIKAARFIPVGAYDVMSLDDPVIMKACQDFIKPQVPLSGNEIRKRLNLRYDSNISLDVYLNGHLLKAENVDVTRPLDSGASLNFFVQEGYNQLTVKTGLFNKAQLSEAKAVIGLSDSYDIDDLNGIDLDTIQPEDGYAVNGKTSIGDKVTSVTLTKKIGELVLVADEEKTLEFNYDPTTDRLTAL